VREPADPVRVQRMSAWLAELSRRGESSHLSAGGFQLLLAGMGLAAGAIFAFNPQYANTVDRGFDATIIFVLGAGTLASAIYTLSSSPTTDQLRYARWRALPSVDAVTLARFEGELAAEAAVGRQVRIMSGVSSIGIAAGGAAIVGITPLSRMQGDAVAVAYVFGATYALLGLWGAIASLTGESPHEHAYHAYEAGKSPESAKVAFSPVLARGGGGMQLGMTF
jgi:hypothetical protein